MACKCRWYSIKCNLLFFLNFLFMIRLLVKWFRRLWLLSSLLTEGVVSRTCTTIDVWRTQSELQFAFIHKGAFKVNNIPVPACYVLHYYDLAFGWNSVFLFFHPFRSPPFWFYFAALYQPLTAIALSAKLCKMAIKPCCLCCCWWLCSLMLMCCCPSLLPL